MTRRLRFAALAAVAALAFSACSNNDAKESDVVNAMTDAGLDQEQAECVGNGFQEAFGDDQDLYNDVAAATDTEDFPEGTEPEINRILDECVDGEGSGGGTETTETTAADGATTSETTEADAGSGG
jgi:hypothetical protein